MYDRYTLQEWNPSYVLLLSGENLTSPQSSLIWILKKKYLKVFLHECWKKFKKLVEKFITFKVKFGCTPRLFYIPNIWEIFGLDLSFLKKRRKLKIVKRNLCPRFRFSHDHNNGKVQLTDVLTSLRMWYIYIFLLDIVRPWFCTINVQSRFMYLRFLNEM